MNVVNARGWYASARDPADPGDVVCQSCFVGSACELAPPEVWAGAPGNVDFAPDATRFATGVGRAAAAVPGAERLSRRQRESMAGKGFRDLSTQAGAGA